VGCWQRAVPELSLSDSKMTTPRVCPVNVLSDEDESDDRILEWGRVAPRDVVSGDTHTMSPLPRTVYSSDDGEDVTLERWLEVQPPWTGLARRTGSRAGAEAGLPSTR
jgi:hypothetical protein